MLLGRERSGYSKTVRDDRGAKWHYHTATIGAMRAAHRSASESLANAFRASGVPFAWTSRHIWSSPTKMAEAHTGGSRVAETVDQLSAPA